MYAIPDAVSASEEEYSNTKFAELPYATVILLLGSKFFKATDALELPPRHQMAA